MRTKKTIINIISSVVSQLIIIICGFIVPRLIIGTFGSNVNGLIQSITQFLAYITLLESGFGPVLKSVLYKPIANKDKNTIAEILKTSEKFFRKIALIFLVYILVLCIVFPIIVNGEISNIFTISLVLIISISTFAEYFFGMTYKLYLQAEQKTYVISLIQISTLIINTMVIVALIKFGASIQVVKLVSAIIFLLRPIMQNLYVKKKYNINLKQAKGNYKIEQKWDALAQQIAYVVHNYADFVLLTFFSNTKEISVYSVYYMIINSIKNLIKSFLSGLESLLGDMIAKGEIIILNKLFSAYEGIYITTSTIIFCTTLFLIVPFVSLYTKGINDVNYIRHFFAFFIVIDGFLETVRQLYNSLIIATGHFKQTRKGNYIEIIINILASTILVFNFGINGVIIGTVISLFIRTIEFMYHTTKYILDRKMFYTFKRLIAITIEISLISIIINNYIKIQVDNYFQLLCFGIIVIIISIIIVFIINYLFFKDNVNNVKTLIKNIFRRKEEI